MKPSKLFCFKDNGRFHTRDGYSKSVETVVGSIETLRHQNTEFVNLVNRPFYSRLYLKFPNVRLTVTLF